MSADRFATRIETLDPESRAIVELSIGRGFSDEDLAGMLGTSVERVGERRARALEHLDARTARDRDAVAAALRGNGAGAPAGTGTGDPVEDAEPSAASGERSPRRRALALAILGGLLVAVAIGVTVALAGGESEPEPIGSGQAVEDPPAAETPADEPPPDDPPADEPPADGGPEAVRLEPPAGGPATGTAELLPAEGNRGRRLLVAVRGLGPRRRSGGYAIWLYDSVSNARMIAGSMRGTFRAQVRLPASADRYRFLDVSFEPPDGNRNHSGASLLRAPLDGILGG
jgi:hypothetical protein